MKRFIGIGHAPHRQFGTHGDHQPHSIGRACDGAYAATPTLHRPERKNPLMPDRCARLRKLFGALPCSSDVNGVMRHRAGDTICSGDDAPQIITLFTRLTTPGLPEFTHPIGGPAAARRRCPSPVIDTTEGICQGAGAIRALVRELRRGTERAKPASVCTRIGLAVADVGARALLPHTVAQRHASEQLLIGCVVLGQEGLDWGLFRPCCSPPRNRRRAGSCKRRGAWEGKATTVLRQGSRASDLQADARRRDVAARQLSAFARDSGAT